MTDNPYLPPGNGAGEFYTDDITTLSARSIWHVSRQQGIVHALILFPYFLARKAVGARFPANYATCRVTSLTATRYDDVCLEIRDALSPYEAVCEDHEMHRVGTFLSPWIGHKSGVYSIWLDPTGAYYCYLAHIQISLKTIERSETVFACHSRLASGIELHTFVIAPENWIPEVIPPNHDLLALMPGTQPKDVIHRHRERIANLSTVVHFTDETLISELVRNSQNQFDFLVAKGIYKAVTAIEVQRLQSVHQPVR